MDDNGKKIGLTDAAGKNTVTLDGNSGKLLLDSQGEITISAARVRYQQKNNQSTFGETLSIWSE